jgi:hypothetical protein
LSTCISTVLALRAVGGSPWGGDDTNGLPVRLGQVLRGARDNRLADKLLSRLNSGSILLADRGYDTDWIRALAASAASPDFHGRDSANGAFC